MGWTQIFQPAGPPAQPGSHGNNQPTPKSQSFFNFDSAVSDQELRDIAANLALTDQPYEDLSDTLDAQEKLAKEDVRLPFQHEETRLKQQKQTVLARFNDFRSRIAWAEARITEHTRKLWESRLTAAHTAALKSSLGLKLQQSRLAQRKVLFEENDQKLAEAPSLFFEELKTQFNRARELHQEWAEAWKKDEPELQRRAQHYREELAETKTALKRLTEHLDFLKSLGFTRTIAGFLVWGGYLWLAGNAVVVSELMTNSTLSKTSILAALLSPLSNWIARTPFWIALLTYLAASLLCLLAVGAVTIVIDATLRWLNPSWAATTWTRRGSSQNSFSLRAIWTGVRELFDSHPLEDVQKEKKKTTPEPTTRWTHLQTIAMLPSLLIGLLMLFLLGAAGTAALSTGASLPDVATLYLSVVWSVVMASCALLYTCHVIQFRWLRMCRDPNLWMTWPWYRRLLLNWEYLLMAIAFLASTAVMASQWGLVPSHRLGIWPPILFSFCVASLTLAYGMVLLGFFRDQRHLEARVQMHQTLLDETLSAPCLTDLLDLEALRGTGQESAAIAKTRHRLRELLLLKRLDDQYALETEQAPAHLDFFEKVAGHLGIAFPWRRKKRVPTAEEIITTIELPEPLMAEWTGLKLQQREAEGTCAAIEAQIKEDRDLISDCEGKASEQDQLLLKLEEEHVKLVRETQTKLRTISDLFARARWVALSAYSMGYQCRWEPPDEPPDWPDPYRPYETENNPQRSKGAAAGGSQ